MVVTGIVIGRIVAHPVGTLATLVVTGIVVGGVVAHAGRAVATLVVTRIVIGRVIAHALGTLAALVVTGIVIGRIVAHALRTLAALVVGDGESADHRNRLRFGGHLVGGGDGETAEQGEGAGDGDAGEDSSTHWGDLLGFGAVIVRSDQGRRHRTLVLGPSDDGGSDRLSPTMATSPGAPPAEPHRSPAMTTPRTRTFAAALVGGLLFLTAGQAVPASAKAGDVRVSGTCTGRSTTKIKLGLRDGRIESETEVDSNRNGQVWSVRMRQNGVLVHNGTARTVAPSGSFTVRKILSNKAGTDQVTAVSRNAATGETCTVTARI